MPRNRWALKIGPVPASISTAPPRKVTIRWPHSARRIMTEPSRCWADSGIVARPSASCTQKIHSRAMSLVLLVARMRASVRRRCSSRVTPMKASRPAMPPETMAITCFCPAVMKGSYSACGVSMPTKCPKNRNSTPMWNRLLAQRRLPARSSCEESLFHVYWSRSKRIQLPMKNTARQM